MQYSLNSSTAILTSVWIAFLNPPAPPAEVEEGCVGTSSSLLLAMQVVGVQRKVISPLRAEERKWSVHSEAVEALMQKKLGGLGSAVGRRPRLGSR